jgi:hypothetical protein
VALRKTRSGPVDVMSRVDASEIYWARVARDATRVDAFDWTVGV